MRWTRWVVLLLVCFHLPLACTVWRGYRVADALMVSEAAGTIAGPGPFGVVPGGILDQRPADLEGTLSRSRQQGSSFLIFPGVEGESGADQPSEPVPGAGSALEMAWLENDVESPPVLLEIDPGFWQPEYGQMSLPAPEAASRSRVLLNPSRDWLPDSWWSRVQHFYLSWTYPSLRLLLLAEGVGTSQSGWDQELNSQGRRLSAVAACGLQDQEGCLQTVSTFVQLAEPPSAAAVLEALQQGSTFVGLLSLGDPRGFSFHALNRGRSYRMGSRVPAGSELVFQAPRPVLFTVLRSGAILHQLEGVEFKLNAGEPGIYRVVASRPDLPLDPVRYPWIISSPIYVGE